MVINSFSIYLISLADEISIYMSILFFIFIILSIIFFVIGRRSDHCDENNNKHIKLKLAKKCLISSLLILTLQPFIPSTKTLIAMYTIPPIVNNKQVQQLPDNLLKFANDYLTKEIKKEDK